MRFFADTRTFAELTCKQRHALRTDGFLLINAVAGSGKTRQLVALVLKALMEGRQNCDLSHFAIITFTRKAGGELRDRLKKAMEVERDDAPSNEEKQFWERHLADLPAARVGTTDALVQDLLRRLALVGNSRIDPALGVLDDLGIADLLERAVDRVLDSPDQPVDSAIKILQRNYDRRSIVAMVREFFDQGDANLVRHAIEYVLASKENGHTLADQLLQPCRSRWLDQWQRIGPTVADSLKRAVVELGNRSTGVVNDIKTIAQTWMWRADKLHESFKVLSAYPFFTEKQTKRTQGLSSTKEGIYSNALDKFQDLLLPLVQDFAKLVDTSRLAEWEDQEQYRSWCILFQAVETVYEHMCHDENRYSFQMLTSMLDRELAKFDEDGKKKLGLPFQRVMVDEFQDNTTLQWNLTLKLAMASQDPSSWNRITLVGDPEQAIYHWRGSNAQLMELIQGQYLKSNPPADSTWYDKNHAPDDLKYRPSTCLEQKGICTLPDNWRTAKATLQWIDQVSATAMKKVEANHQPLRHGERPEDVRETQAAVYFIKPDPLEEKSEEAAAEEADGETHDDGEVTGFDGRSLEILADRLGRINREQSVEFKDMLILAHSFKPLLEPLLEKLEARGIPYRSLVRSALWRTQHVRDLVSLTKCLADPDDGLALLAVLRGPFCRLTDSEILFISHLGKPEGLLAGFDALQGIGQTLKNIRDLEQNLADPPGRLDALRWVSHRLHRNGSWRMAVDRMPHHQLLRAILDESGAWEAWHQWLQADLTLSSNSRQRKQDRFFGEMEVALRRVENIELERPLTLVRLASILEDHVDDKVTETVETELAEGENLVRIMTVHTSKGLQARVVALLIPEVSRKGGNKGRSNPSMILLDRQYFEQDAPQTLVEKTIGLPLFSLTNLDRSEEEKKGLASLFEVAKKCHQHLDEQEKARLLHVALTRAESIVLIAGVPEVKEDDRRHWPQVWVESVQNPFVQKLDHTSTAGDNSTVAVPHLSAQEDSKPSFYFTMPTTPIACTSVAVTTMAKLVGIQDKHVFQKEMQHIRDSLRPHVGAVPVHQFKAQDATNSPEIAKAIGTLVHRAFQMGEAFPMNEGPAKALLKAMTTPLLQPPADEDGDDISASIGLKDNSGDLVVESTFDLITKIRRGETPQLKRLLDSPGQAEVDFCLPLPWEEPTHIIRGRFDSLLEDGSIVDWKTDKGSIDELKEKYKEQMQLYALAKFLDRDKQPNTIIIHLAITGTGEVIDMLFSGQELRVFQHYLEAMLINKRGQVE